MIRRLSLLFLLILPIYVSAQQITGSWEVFTVYNAVDKVLETPNKLYYLSSGNLYSYDSVAQETESYNTQNGLNDSGISDMYYNATDKYLLLTYSNGNIDMLYDNGDVVNMSDIKDAIMSTEKTINHVAFCGDRICVATNFGVVLFDGKKHHVIQSGIYKKNINIFVQVGDYYVISKDNYLYYLPATEKFNVIDNFKPMYSNNANTSATSCYFKDVVVLNDNSMLATNNGSSTLLRIYTFDFSYNKAVANNIGTTNMKVVDINPWSGGYYITDGSTVMTVDKDGANAVETVMPTGVSGQKIAFWSGVDKVWACDNSGIGRYDISGESLTVLNDKFKPGNLTVTDIEFLSPDAYGNIYLTSRSASSINTSNQSYETKTYVNRITEDGEIENITPQDMVYNFSGNPSISAKALCANINIKAHPTDEGVYYLGNFFEGVIKCRDDHYVYSYNGTNSTIPKPWGWIGGAIDFDKNGNMWVLCGVSKNPVMAMLPAEKVTQESTTVEDWYSLPGHDCSVGTTHDAQIIACKKSNVVIGFSGVMENSPLYVNNTNGTLATSDDTFREIATFTDQDGKQFTSYMITCGIECSNGKVWIGTDDGIFEISNPEKFGETGNVVRIKVPRNDGTNMADYLLSSQFVMGISEDNSGRKWISTRDSGIYLVSEDGTEILENFTEDNSVLTSNSVHSVACSKVSNAVYFGAEGILYRYNSTSAPAASDYSNVVAYPNPVRPDFSGWITIKGLMDNSLVKIADAAGNVVYQTTSEGGMAVWDGCNLSGERVRTGVYYIFASQSGEEQSTTGSVAKIMVVR
ncbi:MAG: hypothetical protein ACI30M_02475 [Muribaculaceae bacterium]